MCPFSTAVSSSTNAAQAKVESFISDASFPCVGARSALNKDRIRYGHYESLGSEQSALALHRALRNFSREFADPGTQPVSFIATFSSEITDELSFERLLWRQLQQLHELDVGKAEWDATVSSDPNDEQFSMSVAGRAFFVVGLHPASSRLARRSPMPSLVFNFHDQFEALKQSGKYATMQKAIRTRDVALQGSVNPVLTRFGEASEARQYSGRAVPAGWVCPFSTNEAAHV